MTKERNRQQMPLCTAFIDSMREYFQDLQVTYASENGVTLGQIPESGCSDFILQKDIDSLSVIDSESVKRVRRSVKRG